MSHVVLNDSIFPFFNFLHDFTCLKHDTFKKSHYLIFRMNKIKDKKEM